NRPGHLRSISFVGVYGSRGRIGFVTHASEAAERPAKSLAPRAAQNRCSLLTATCRAVTAGSGHSWRTLQLAGLSEIQVRTRTTGSYTRCWPGNSSSDSG